MLDTTDVNCEKRIHKQLLATTCPFFITATGQCKINRTLTTPDRQKFCRSDEHDGCPTYLGYLLRRSSPLRNDHDWLDSDA